MSSTCKALVVLLLSFIVSAPAWAATIRLYERHGVQANAYNQLIESLRPGDTLEFSNGHSFRFERALGSGETTKVLLVDGGSKVLRVPLRSGIHQPHFNNIPYSDYLRLFLDGYRELKRAGVPVVEVFESESDVSEYLVVEKLELKMLLRHVLFDLATPEQLSGNAVEKLFEFARATWQFAELADFGGTQLGWTGERWVLFDFTRGSTWHNMTAPGMTAFDDLPSSEMREQLKNAVLAARNAATRCKRLLTGDEP